MGCWAIYQTGSGALFDLAASPPELTGLVAQGLGAVYFGEDKPDLSVLRWCPKRLSFVAITDARELEELRGMVAHLAARLSECEAKSTDALQGATERHEALARGVNALADDVAACDRAGVLLGEGFERLSRRVDTVDSVAAKAAGRLENQVGALAERLSVTEEVLAELTTPKPSFWSRLKG